MRLMPATDYEDIRLYRSPEEIRGDISVIAGCIERANMRLSIHNIMSALAADARSTATSEMSSLLEKSVAEARVAIRRMERLCKSLDDLIIELEEARWAFGI